MAYEEKKTAPQIVAPTSWRMDNTAVSKISINATADAVPSFMGGQNKKEELKPRGYNEYTKKFDSNHMKLGLRQ